jgi:thiol-disulfide isomerase/thioredoxin
MSPTIRFLLAAACALLAAAARAEVKPGDPFPSLAGAALKGPLPATAGQVVLVDFWASWCAPCKSSFPVYARLQADYAARGFVIVAVSVDDDPAAYAAFVKRLHPPFATVLDQAQRLVSAVNAPTMPTCYLLGRDGRVRFVHVGFHGEETDRELRRQIDALLSENHPSP